MALICPECSKEQFVDEYGGNFKCKSCRTELEVAIEETDDGPEFWLTSVDGTCGVMIDVTTTGDDGHWDHADIKRLCEYRDRLKAALVGSNQWLVSALTCGNIHWDAGQKVAATEAYEKARALLDSQSDGGSEHDRG